MNSTDEMLNRTTYVLSAFEQVIQDFKQWQYYITIALLFPMGFLGSLISFTIYSRRIFRNTAMGKYLIAQSSSDMLLQVYTIWVSVLHDYPQLTCQTIISIFSISFTFNSLIKAAVSLDRMVLVRFPTQMLFIKKSWFQYMTIALVTLLSVVPIATLQFLTGYEGIRNGIKSCYVQRDPFSLQVIYIYRNYDLYLGQLIPFSTMLVCGIIIMQRVFKMKAKIKKTHNKERILAIYTFFSISWYLMMSLTYMCVLTFQIYFFNPFQPSTIYTFCLLFGLFLKNIEINSSFLIFILFNRLYRGELLILLSQLVKRLKIYKYKRDPDGKNNEKSEVSGDGVGITAARSGKVFQLETIIDNA